MSHNINITQWKSLPKQKSFTIEVTKGPHTKTLLCHLAQEREKEKE